ncbi:MAG: TRAP transporter substrate-binding protein DctP [Phascolarctobacterium sp.]|nr:TRAP transporter substrate-binding protein DctP [Phascolarctobacterium sp.]
MKLSKKFTAAALVAALVLVAGCGGSDKKADAPKAGADKKVTLKLAAQLPASHWLVKNMDSLKTKVAAKTNNTVEIQISAAGATFKDKNMNDAIVSGALDMGLNTVGRWAQVIPAMNVFDVPFLFPSYEQIDKAIDGGVGKMLGDELQKKGVRPLIWADYGFVQFANNKKLCKTPDDFKGMKIRGYSKYSSETIKAIGASSTTMSSGEVYMAIKNGTLDGQISGTPAMMSRKMYEVHKYLTITNNASPEFIVAMNEKSFQKLSANQQKALLEAAAEVRDDIRKQAKSEDLKANDEMKKNGCELYTMTPEDIKVWQAKTKPVWDLFVKENGEVGKKLIEMCTK